MSAKSVNSGSRVKSPEYIVVDQEYRGNRQESRVGRNILHKAQSLE